MSVVQRERQRGIGRGATRESTVVGPQLQCYEELGECTCTLHAHSHSEAHLPSRTHSLAPLTHVHRNTRTGTHVCNHSHIHKHNNTTTTYCRGIGEHQRSHRRVAAAIHVVDGVGPGPLRREQAAWWAGGSVSRLEENERMINKRQTKIKNQKSSIHNLQPTTTNNEQSTTPTERMQSGVYEVIDVHETSPGDELSKHIGEKVFLRTFHRCRCTTCVE
jgi:hypothetical protein